MGQLQVAIFLTRPKKTIKSSMIFFKKIKITSENIDIYNKDIVELIEDTLIS